MTQTASRDKSGGKVTRKANHAILLRHRSNRLRSRGFPSIAPREFILLGDLGELGIQLSGLFIVLLDRLLAMGSEGVFIQCIDVDRQPDGMGGSDACNAAFMSSTILLA